MWGSPGLRGSRGLSEMPTGPPLQGAQDCRPPARSGAWALPWLPSRLSGSGGNVRLPLCHLTGLPGQGRTPEAAATGKEPTWVLGGLDEGPGALEAAGCSQQGADSVRCLLLTSPALPCP